ncbi:solute:sodium symporter family transporter [Pelagicoccus mobilis]|uniref:Solute:sodium symporter family transporter n=1 Tax=Pelagicoccus mobilis TaxID=415221 RepID=A0A934S311_9BACT|nr:solute:sodium symporter family transporter [Pelagicoccus mobilis]MBK1880169.1 solute:sodium symporter family transporter [Pelagicoccus mobilis]
MSLVPLLTFVLFTAFVGFISYLKSRDEDLSHSTGYFLAGRSLSWYVIAGSLFLTNISAEQLTGLNGNAFSFGASVMAWETTSVITLIVLAVFFLPRYLKSGVTTVPQFLEERYGTGMRRVSSFIFLYALIIGFLPFVLYAGAITLGKLFDVSGLLGVSESSALWIMIVSLGVIGGCYAVFGGLKAVAVSDSINGVGLVVGGLIIPVLALIKLGGGDMGSGWSILVNEAPERMRAAGVDPDMGIPWHTLFTGMILINLFYWCTNQAIVQRALAAKTLAEGQKGVLGAAFLKLIGVSMLVLPGIVAWHMHQKGIIDVPVKSVGEDGSVVFHHDMAYPLLVREVLPAWLTGFFGAVMFGAILSSFNSGVNSMSTLFSLDIYKGMIRKDASDEQTVRAGKIFGSILIVVCIIIAPVISQADGLYTFMRTIMAVINVPILTVILFGVISKRGPALCGYIGLPFGMAFFAFANFYLENDFGVFKWHWLHSVGLNFVLMMLVMTIVRYLKPMPEPYVQKESGEVEIRNWRYLGLASGVAVVLLVALYVVFSDIGILNT